MLQYLNGLGYLCQKAETTWSHVLHMSVLLQKYLTILHSLLCLHKTMKTWMLTPSKVLQTQSCKIDKVRKTNIYILYMYVELFTLYINTYGTYKERNLLNIWQIWTLPYNLDHAISCNTEILYCQVK